MRLECELPMKGWRNNSWADRLDNILNQRYDVTSPAFWSFSEQEIIEFNTALPYMTDKEQWKIADAIHTSNLIYRVAEAVWRVRSEWKFDLIPS